MSRHAHVPPALRSRVFLGREAVARGLLSPAQLRGRAWHRLLRGVYADAKLARDHDLMVHAASLVIPSSAAITGLSAAWFWGARLAAPTDPVDVVCPHPFGPVTGLRIRTAALPPSDVDTLCGTRFTTPRRTAWELAQRLEIADAVAVIDAMARLGRLDPAALARYLERRRGHRGHRIAERVLALVDGRAESPQESRLRALLSLAGLPRPVPQYEIRTTSGFIARVDLAWPHWKVAAEYDGAWHSETGQLAQDRRRLNRIIGAGWLVHHVTARDLHDPRSIVAAIRHLLGRRSDN